MRRVVAYFIRHPIWTTVLLLGIIGFGVISKGRLRYSFFPEIIPDIITIQIAYPGAAPEEVAEGVVLKIEENLDGLAGVERVTSVSRENSGIVSVEITREADIDKVLVDVKNAVDRINSFPVDAEEPIIFEQKFRTRSLSVVLFGAADRHNLKYIAEQFRDDLLAMEGISQVAFEGLPNLEFSIEVAEADLRRYGISFDEITAAVRKANINISGGKLDTDDEEILIRAWGRSYRAEELDRIPVRGNADGSVIYLGDIATTREQWEDIPDKRYYNDQTAVILNIDQTEQEDILAIADSTKAYIERFNESNETLQAVVIDDRTIPLTQRIDLLVKNGLIGLLLVLMTLGFFLKLRLSFWVAVGIPFSFAGMFIIAGFSGITINVISLFGMIIVVGILVDDAIVVAENIYAHHERGEPALKAAVDGTMEVLAPVTTSIATTVIAFVPFFYLDGMLGKIIWQMALVVIASLVFSLIEAFLVLPSHLAHSKGLQRDRAVPAIRKRVDNLVHALTHRVYAPLLRAAMTRITITTPIALVMLTVGLVRGGLIGVTFFPFIDSDTVPINVSLVAGSQEVDTDSLLAGIEQVCWEVNEEFRSEREDSADIVIGIKRDIGSNDLGESGSHAGRLVLQLMDAEQRDLQSYEIANRIREVVGPLPGVQNITFGKAGHFGKPIVLSLLGNDVEQLDKARHLLVAELKSYGILKDITDSDQEGRREIDIALKPRAHTLGLTLQDVAGQVRQGFFGQEIQRIQRGRDEIRVWARYRPEDRLSLGQLDRMRIRTTDGGEYPFSELATYRIKRGITTISHLDRKREIKIEASPQEVEVDLPPILDHIENDILPRVLSQVHGITAAFEGQSRDQAKMVRSIKRTFPVALAGMFILVVLVFRSYAQALLVLSLIPIGALGAIWGHGIQGLQISMMSLIGFIALSGIIINDSIILVDRINRNLRLGHTLFDAVHNAGLTRLRPILLTTITTSLGLAPLILETSRQAQFLIPMAISVAYGLLFGSFILLLILPTSYIALSSIRVRWSRLLTGRAVTPEALEPAVKELNRQIVE
jgi:multidrug efflux pump subunit AcrB